ncbi:MAG: outer membrane beta-barrel protein [Acidobacteriota bacterium]|nr:outer membrane beta-barrel protein [Acidobacteriota bacterium]
MRSLQAFVILVLTLLVPSLGWGQAATSGEMESGITRFEAGGNYNWIHANAPPGQCGCFSLNGGSGVFLVNLTHAWAGVADITYAHANNVDGTSQNITILNYLFGARYSRRNHTRFTPYAEVLFGGAKEDVNFNFTINRNAFGLSGGGGVTMPLGQRFNYTIVQVDYVHTRIPNGVNNSQNNTRVVTGFTYKF